MLESLAAMLVSTHAPLRGATIFGRLLRLQAGRFNPRTPAGCDGGCRLRHSAFSRVSTHAPLRGATHSLYPGGRPSVRFNPRTPAGCDSSLTSYIIIIESFNPRTPAGCDEVRMAEEQKGAYVSTHAPLRGATWLERHGLLETYVSTHAPLRGATLLSPMVRI